MCVVIHLYNVQIVLIKSFHLHISDPISCLHFTTVHKMQSTENWCMLGMKEMRLILG